MQVIIHRIAGWNIHRVQEACQRNPRDRQHHQRDRNAYAHPLRETDFNSVVLSEIANQECVRWRANQCGKPANARGIREPQQHRYLKIAAALCGKIGNVIVNHCNDGQYNRQQHHRRRGVRHPHAQHGADEHESADQSLAVGPGPVKDRKRDTPVQIPALKCERHQEATEEQVDYRICVGRGCIPDGRDAQRLEDHERQKCRDGNRNRFRRPPDCHPQAYSGGSPGLWVHGVLPLVGCQHCHEYSGSENAPYDLVGLERSVHEFTPP